MTQHFRIIDAEFDYACHAMLAAATRFCTLRMSLFRCAAISIDFIFVLRFTPSCAMPLYAMLFVPDAARLIDAAASRHAMMMMPFHFADGASWPRRRHVVMPPDSASCPLRR